MDVETRGAQQAGPACVKLCAVHPHFPAELLQLPAAGDGTGEGLVRVYYNCVGWPTFLPTSEQGVFAAKVYQLKQQQMKKLVEQGAIPLRDGVVQVSGQQPTWGRV
jgi:hypothetical protein